MEGRVRVGYRLFSEFKGEAFRLFCGPEVFIGICAQVRAAVHKRMLWDSREWSSNPRIGSTEIKVVFRVQKAKAKSCMAGPARRGYPSTERQLIKVTRS
jgi:hypothetical protein